MHDLIGSVVWLVCWAYVMVRLWKWKDGDTLTMFDLLCALVAMS